MTDLTELNKLEEYLKDKGIRYERIDRKPIQDELGIILHFTERHQICVPKEDLRFKKMGCDLSAWFLWLSGRSVGDYGRTGKPEN